MATSQHREYLESLELDVIKANTPTELSKMATGFCGYFVSADATQKIKKRIIESHGIIKQERSLKGETTMREPTKDDLSRLRAICEERNLPFDRWGIYWDKTKESSIAFYNKEAVEAQENRHAEMLVELRKLAPKYKARKIQPKGEHMLVLPQSDIHVGKWLSSEETGNTYNVQIAVERARQGTAELVAKAKLHGVKQFVVCVGNDILHTDNGKTTTSGTPQDTDGSFFSMYRAAKFLYISIIEELALHADVLIVHVPSNHDWRTGYTLADAVAERFTYHPNVKNMITERHRKYIVYGRNLIMFSHGDGAKERDLLHIIATEAGEVWHKCPWRYAYLGHLHHKIRKVQGQVLMQTEKDKIGITEIDTTVQALAGQDLNIEYVRSPSPADGWHDRNAFVNRPAMEAFLHHEEMGQVGRFTQFF